MHVRELVGSIAAGQFSRGDHELFRPLLDEMLNHDAYLLFADYQSYVDCQDHVAATFLDQEKWSKMSIYNAVRMGGSPLTGRLRRLPEHLAREQTLGRNRPRPGSPRAWSHVGRNFDIVTRSQNTGYPAELCRLSRPRVEIS
jgi:Carbohydrate phosphorylase